MHAYIHTYMHTYIHTYMYDNIPGLCPIDLPLGDSTFRKGGCSGIRVK